MNPETNPWQTLSTRDLYDNPWISIREDQVINPSGGQGIYSVVHFKNLAVGIIPLDDDMNTWLVGQYRYPLDEYSWEIPMGGAPPEDGPLTGAVRELREETGLTASYWQEFMKLHPSNSVTDECGFVYLATGLTAGETEHDETEALRLKKLPVDEAIDKVLRSEITDCISVAALLRLRIALQENEIELPLPSQ